MMYSCVRWAAGTLTPLAAPNRGSWCAGGMAGHCCCCRVLLPQLSAVVVEDIWRNDGLVVIAAHPRSRGVRCGRCGRASTRVHSSYLALALAGRAGPRMATALGMPVSRSTLLRRIRRLPDPRSGR